MKPKCRRNASVDIGVGDSMIRLSESQVRKALGGTKEVDDSVGQGDFPVGQQERREDGYDEN